MNLDHLLNGLRAVAEPSRLRILAVLARNELTVSELTTVLVQSQPRISRHLKLLHEAGLIERAREGAWVFYRLAGRGAGADLVRALLGRLDPGDDVTARDIARLEQVRTARLDQATRYFRDNAPHWDRIRSLYVADDAVERALLEAAGDGPYADLLDIGTGTGRMLELFASRIEHGVGIDSSHEMLNVARANLDRAGIRHCQVRHADLFHLPLPDASFDLVVVHQVLHYLDDVAGALTETARLLRPGGRLLVVDFAPHDLEFLRAEHAHRRLGFSDHEIDAWCEAAGLAGLTTQVLDTAPETPSDTTRLTVCVWSASRPTLASSPRARGQEIHT